MYKNVRVFMYCVLYVQWCTFKLWWDIKLPKEHQFELLYLLLVLPEQSIFGVFIDTWFVLDVLSTVGITEGTERITYMYNVHTFCTCTHETQVAHIYMHRSYGTQYFMYSCTCTCMHNCITCTCMSIHTVTHVYVHVHCTCVTKCTIVQYLSVSS